MSAYIVTRNDDQLGSVVYLASYTYRYGVDNEHQRDVPAKVSVDFTHSSIVLDIADAEELMHQLAAALVEHAVALKASNPTAVA